MTAAAHMPQSCRGRYRRVALVQLNQEYTAKDLRPKMISARAKGVVRLVDYGRHCVGKTERGAYQRALIEAVRQVLVLNAAPPYLHETLLAAWRSNP